VKFEFIAAEQGKFPVEFMCTQLGVSRSGFYAFRNREVSTREQSDAELARRIEDIHAGSRKRYGSPRVHAVLQGEGVKTSRKRVARLMRQQGLCARRRRRFRKTTDSNHPHPIAPNLLERQFDVTAPNTVWAGDITYIETRQGWLYLAVLIDLYSRMVVGWSMRADMDRALCMNAVKMAVAKRRPGPGLLHHTDRGSQYASGDYRALLVGNGMVCSMSRKGDCWDNAVSESFFKTLKAELVDEADFATRAEARVAIFEFIEVWYNRQRLHSHLGYKSPEQHEAQPQSATVST
jgi:transposase InsO family protein